MDANKNNGAMFSQSMIVCAIYSTKFGIIFPVVIKMIPSMIHDMLFVFALSCYLCFFLLFVFIIVYYYNSLKMKMNCLLLFNVVWLVPLLRSNDIMGFFRGMFGYPRIQSLKPINVVLDGNIRLDNPVLYSPVI